VVFAMRVDRYLAREALPAFATALLLVAGLAMISAAIPRLPWIAGSPWPAILAWLLALSPQAFVQSSALALVLAVLTSIGRLRHDKEWLALQAGGVSRRYLLSRTLGLGILFALSVLAGNQWLIPAANAAASRGYERLLASQSSLFRVAAQGLYVPGLSLRSERVLADGTLLGVRLERWDGEVYTLVRAERGRLDGRELLLWDHRTQRFDFGALGGASSFGLQGVIRLDARASGEGAPLVITTGVDERALLAGAGAAGSEDARSLVDLYRDSRAAAAGSTAQREASVLLHRRLAEAFAHVALLVLGFPLALAFGASRTQGLGIGLLLVLGWYLLYAAGYTLALAGVLPAWLGVWGANLLFAGVGGGRLLIVRLRA